MADWRHTLFLSVVDGTEARSQVQSVDPHQIVFHSVDFSNAAEGIVPPFATQRGCITDTETEAGLQVNPKLISQICLSPFHTPPKSRGPNILASLPKGSGARKDLNLKARCRSSCSCRHHQTWNSSGHPQECFGLSVSKLNWFWHQPSSSSATIACSLRWEANA